MEICRINLWPTDFYYWSPKFHRNRQRLCSKFYPLKKQMCGQCSNSEIQTNQRQNCYASLALWANHTFGICLYTSVWFHKTIYDILTICHAVWTKFIVAYFMKHMEKIKWLVVAANTKHNKRTDKHSLFHFCWISEFSDHISLGRAEQQQTDLRMVLKDMFFFIKQISLE